MRAPDSPASVVERAGSNDLMNLAADRVGVPTNVAAVLVLGRPAPRFAALRRELERRLVAVPRLRQRLVRVPVGCGRPVWLDDPTFDVRLHVTALAAPPPGDERCLLDLAVPLVTRRLPMDRPLWAVTFVTGLAGGGTGLVLVLHHVLADGIGGLAVLAALVDGASIPEPPAFPLPRPSRWALVRDAFLARLRAVRRLPGVPGRLRAAFVELLATRWPHAARCSLNGPTGPRRRFAVAHADLGAARAVSRACGATVNDVLLAAIGGALRRLLDARGEQADPLIASVLVSGRAATGPSELGNRVGVMTVPLSAGERDRWRRLAAIVVATRAHKRAAARGASAYLLDPVFRLLAALRLLRWFTNRQQVVTTFVTNLRGPDEPLSFLGAPVRQLIPCPSLVGNVTVAFGVLSYAGRLTMTVLVDPARCPESDLLAAMLQEELDAFVAGALSAADGLVVGGERGPPPDELDRSNSVSC